ncbi:MAG: DUF362 domain-containing protein [Clostridiales bacterium]|nr:DUF362 domain-containing protein [Clostridiales bacterium]
MKQNEIIKIYGTNYKEMTKQLLERANLAAEIPSADLRIGIKPNLVTPTPADYGATTHPEVAAGIVEYLQEHGFFRIVVLEGAWVGDKTSEAFEYCGYRTLSEQYGVELWDTQKDSSHVQDCAGVKLHICDMVDAIDFLINVPVLKGHCQTRITCALKNSKGLIPNSEKRRFHTMGLHKPIAHLGVGIRQDFIVVDHICGDLDFEEGGNPVVRDCIMAAKDPVLVDAYVCHLLHYSVADVPYVGMAEELGVGSADLKTAQIFCIGPDQEGEIESRRKVVAVEDAVEAVDSCSACYASLIPALDRLREEGLLEQLDEKIAIGQGYRGQHGRLGVGLCTAGFDVCVKGCPPTEEQVYEELKSYIRRGEEGI